MTLLPNWKTVLRRSWSLRLLALAGLLSGIEAALPAMDFFLPRGLFAVLSFVVTCGAFVARLIAQQSISGQKKEV